MVDAGGAIVEVLASYGGGAPTKANLNAWVTTHNLPVTSVIDSPSSIKTLTFFGIRETCVIVDVRTMKIVKKVNGSVTGTGDSSVKQLIPEILKLLAAG